MKVWRWTHRFECFQTDKDIPEHYCGPLIMATEEMINNFNSALDKYERQKRDFDMNKVFYNKSLTPENFIDPRIELRLPLEKVIELCFIRGWELIEGSIMMHNFEYIQALFKKNV